MDVEILENQYYYNTEATYKKKDYSQIIVGRQNILLLEVEISPACW